MASLLTKLSNLFTRKTSDPGNGRRKEDATFSFDNPMMAKRDDRSSGPSQSSPHRKDDDHSVENPILKATSGAGFGDVVMKASEQKSQADAVQAAAQAAARAAAQTAEQQAALFAIRLRLLLAKQQDEAKKYAGVLKVAEEEKASRDAAEKKRVDALPKPIVQDGKVIGADGVQTQVDLSKDADGNDIASIGGSAPRRVEVGASVSSDKKLMPFVQRSETPGNVGQLVVINFSGQETSVNIGKDSKNHWILNKDGARVIEADVSKVPEGLKTQFRELPYSEAHEGKRTTVAAPPLPKSPASPGSPASILDGKSAREPSRSAAVSSVAAVTPAAQSKTKMEPGVAEKDATSAIRQASSVVPEAKETGRGAG